MCNVHSAWWRSIQAAIVLALHSAVFGIHAVLKSYHRTSPMLIESLNMRECGGLLFGPSRELTRDACAFGRWDLWGWSEGRPTPSPEHNGYHNDSARTVCALSGDLRVPQSAYHKGPCLHSRWSCFTLQLDAFVKLRFNLLCDVNTSDLRRLIVLSLLHRRLPK